MKKVSNLFSYFSLTIGFLFFFFPLFSGSSIIAKKDTGTDNCYPIDNIYNGISLHLYITINDDNSASNCSFPWVIKVFERNSNIEIGQSNEFFLNNFGPKNQFNLRSADLFFTLIGDRPFSSINCFETNEGEFYSKIDVTYKIFSGSQELDINCSWFNSPFLFPNSINYNDELYFCSCTSFNKNGPYGASLLNSNKEAQENRTSELSANFIERNFERRNINEKSIMIFPNPASTLIKIVFSNPYNKAVTIELYSIQGQLLKKAIPSGFTENIISIDLFDIPKGPHLLKIKNDAVSFYTKMFIKN